MEKKCTICIGDNHAIFREGIKSLLSARPHYDVIAEGENGIEIIDAVKQTQPDLVLLDLTMPKMNGLDVIKSLKTRFPDVKIIVLTLHNTDEYIHTALSAGADGYILKDANYNELELAINAVLKNQTFLSPAISDKIVKRYIHGDKSKIGTAYWDILTTREREHLTLIAEAYSNKKIAECLSISVKTVEKHRSNLMKKLGMHSAVELTAFAIENGLVDK